VRASLSAVRDLVGGTGAASVLWADFITAQVDGAYADATADVQLARGVHLLAYYAFRWQQARGEAPAAAPLPDITRHVAGLRLVGVLGVEADPPRAAKEAKDE
jgi:hypothetical protein